MNARFCATCGTAVPPASNFCPKCGAAMPDLLETIPAYVPPPTAAPAAAAPPVAASPVAPAARPSRSAMAIGVPIAMLVLGLIIWALLAGMPFGSDKLERREGEKFEPIAEGEAPAGANSRELIVEGEPPPTVTQPPPAVATTPPVSIPVPVPVSAPATPAPASEISQDEAVSTLRSYVTSRDDYGVSSDCASISVVEYANAGYTLDVSDTCDQRPLGRWRVDAKTREIFRQRSDGRYLRP